jgi:ferredoxin-NADP reductase
MAMVRHRAAAGSDVPTRLLLSSRTWDDVIYRDELTALGARHDRLEIVHTLTRGQPDGWAGYSRRVDVEMLREVAWTPSGDARAYVCGPTAFVETVAESLVGLGYDAGRVRTERFGATS